MARITALVLCARSQDSLLSVSMCRVHVVFATAEFREEESRILRHVNPRAVEGHPESLAHLAGIELKPTVH